MAVAIANTSTYIQGGIEYSTSVSGSTIYVTVKLYFRRTNSWSGQTYSSNTSQYICISGDPNNYGYSQSSAITVNGGQQNVWQGPVFTATRAFDSSRSGNTIYIGWKTQDNAGSYFTGSANAQITLPNAYTDPSGLSISISELYTDGAKFNVSLSSYGNPSSASGRWIEAGIAGQNAWQSPLRSDKVINTSSAQITVNNSSTQTQTLTIQPNTQYYYGGYAYNTQRAISQINGTLVTPANAPTYSVSSVAERSAVIRYSTSADGGKYAKSLQYSINNGSTWVTGATVNTGSASSGTFTISGLDDDTTYTLRSRTVTTAGTIHGSNISFTTLPAYKTYVSVGNKAKKVKKLYVSVGGKAKKVKKLYVSVGGKAKRVL